MDSPVKSLPTRHEVSHERSPPRQCRAVDSPLDSLPTRHEACRGDQCQVAVAPPPPPLKKEPPHAASGFRPETRRIHKDLYEDAFARQQRLHDMKEEKLAQERERKRQERENRQRRTDNAQGRTDNAQGPRRRHKLYQIKDTRTHLEREEDALRRRKELEDLGEMKQRERELEELQKCTFHPLIRKGRGPPGARQQSPGLRSTSPRATQAASSSPGRRASRIDARLQQLVERQLAAIDTLQVLANQDASLVEHFQTLHRDLHDRIQLEETNRVVAMLQDSDARNASQQELIQRVRGLVEVGTDPDSAQKVIVEELVSRSQHEVRRRVLEAFAPMKSEAEADLYDHRLAVTQELETLEEQVLAMRGGSLCDDARRLGFRFGVAEKARRAMPAAPTPLVMPPGKSSTPGTPRVLTVVNRMSSSPFTLSKHTFLEQPELPEGAAQTPPSPEASRSSRRLAAATPPRSKLGTPQSTTSRQWAGGLPPSFAAEGEKALETSVESDFFFGSPASITGAVQEFMHRAPAEPPDVTVMAEARSQTSFAKAAGDAAGAQQAGCMSRRVSLGSVTTIHDACAGFGAPDNAADDVVTFVQ